MFWTKKQVGEAGIKPQEGRKFVTDMILEAMIDGVSIADVNGNMIQANGAFAKMLGYEAPKNLIGESIVSIITEKDLPKVMEEFKKCIATTIVMNVEFGMKRKDGSELPCMLNGTALKNEKGDIVGLIGVMRDITELKKAQEKERELAAAAAAEKKKAEELAAMNEELESANEELRQTNEELESTTEELRVANEEARKEKETAQKKAEQLERFNKVAVDRELKMKELKKRIEELEGKRESRES